MLELPLPSNTHRLEDTGKGKEWSTRQCSNGLITNYNFHILKFFFFAAAYYETHVARIKKPGNFSV